MIMEASYMKAIGAIEMDALRKRFPSLDCLDCLDDIDLCLIEAQKIDWAKLCENYTYR
jgi:hypothetical protein